MFVGREKEIELLNDHYQSNHFEFEVIYGRRRIGKTHLIKEFIQDKNAIYYMSVEASASTNLNYLSRAVLQKDNLALGQFTDFEALFKDISRRASKERLVFVIDEYPYLAESVPEMASLIQRFCDHEWINTQLQLILCGSSMSFMENEVLGSNSPLYGRRTAQIKLKPFTYFESEILLKSMNKVDIAILHYACSGVAEYLSYVDPNKDLKYNITQLFLKESGRLYEESMSFLKQELREPRIYHEILNAIAYGASRSNEIATKINIQTGALNRYLENLIELGILEKQLPIKEKNKRPIYRIVDGSYRFWYRYVLPNLSAIQIGLGERVYETTIEKDLPNFMGEGFERIFLDVIDDMNKKNQLNDLITSRGRWWGNNPLLKRQEEIDCVAFGIHKTYFCEVKWTNEKVDLGILKSLIEKSLLIEAKDRNYILFSKNGFTQTLVDYQKAHDTLSLITLENI